VILNKPTKREMNEAGITITSMCKGMEKTKQIKHTANDTGQNICNVWITPSSSAEFRKMTRLTSTHPDTVMA
jgi:hypothetical protein